MRLGWGERSLDLYVKGKVKIPAHRLFAWAEDAGFRIELR